MDNEVLIYIEKLYNKYNRKLRSSKCTIAEADRLGYVVPELEKIINHFNK